MPYPNPTLRISLHAISIFLLRQQAGRNEVLLLRPAQNEAAPWNEIAGCIEPGEAAWQAAVRETRRATGLTPDILYAADYCASYYDHACDRALMVPVFVGMLKTGSTGPLRQIQDRTETAWFGYEAALEALPLPAPRRVLREIWDSFVLHRPPALLRIPLPDAGQSKSEAA